jgi:hypothetical protein
MCALTQPEGYPAGSWHSTVRADGYASAPIVPVRPAAEPDSRGTSESLRDFVADFVCHSVALPGIDVARRHSD